MSLSPLSLWKRLPARVRAGKPARALRLLRRFAKSTSSPGSIAMLHNGRCGSTVLCDLLGQHSNMFWDRELFETIQQGGTPFGTQFTSDPMVLLRIRRRYAGNCFYGFETKLHELQHLRPELIGMSAREYINKLQALGFDYFVFLKRENYLRKIVSGIVGRKAKGWHIREGEKPSLHRIHIDFNNIPFGRGSLPILEFFHEHERMYTCVEEHIPEHKLLKMTYENDILADPKVGYRKACAFFGIPTQDVSVKLRRTNPFPLSQIIENYEEVAGFFRGTEYEWMLEDQQSA